MEVRTSLSARVDMHASRTSSIHNDTSSHIHAQAPDSSNAPNNAREEQQQRQVQNSMSLWRKIAIAMKQRENRKLAACYWALAAAGWNDASLGPLIPYIEEQYRISYTVVSTMFISQCVGYIFAGVTMNRFTDKLGMGRMLTIGACLQMLGYAVCIAPPPFAVLPVVYIFIGCGVAYQDAGANAWVAGLPNNHQKLGYLHGAYIYPYRGEPVERLQIGFYRSDFYYANALLVALCRGRSGLGGLLSPLVATAFIQAGIKWSFFFSVSLSFAFTNVCVLYMCFWRDNAPMDHEQDRSISTNELQKSQSETGSVADVNGSSAIELDSLENASTAEGRAQLGENEADLVTGGASGAPALAPEVEAPSRRTTAMKDKEIFTNKIVWLSAFFLLLYVGAEVSIGGWIVTYLIDERDGPVAAGYVSSGFWGGITLGRVLLPTFNVWVGERNVVFLYIALALGLEFVIWFVRDLISNAIAVSLVGFVLGPFFPIAISVAGKLLPRYLHTGAIGMMAAVGSAGAAIFPFITGLLAQAVGTWVLQPIIVSLLVVMAATWAFIPNPGRRTE